MRIGGELRVRPRIGGRVDTMNLNDDIWPIGSTVSLEWDEAKDARTGDYLNNLTVSAQVTDSDGDNVGDAITLSYVSGSNGRYVGDIPAATTAAMSEGSDYTATITATSSGGTFKSVRKITRPAGYGA